jgi:hypothetical protein
MRLKKFQKNILLPIKDAGEVTFAVMVAGKHVLPALPPPSSRSHF